MSSDTSHTIVSHFNWIPELLFTGLLYMMTASLRTFSLTTIADGYTATPFKQILILASMVITLLAEWIYTLFTISMLYFQFYDWLYTHVGNAPLNQPQPPISGAHLQLHRLLSGVVGRVMIVAMVCFIYILCTVQSIQYTSDVVAVHSYHSPLGNVMWAACATLDILCLLVTSCILYVGGGTSTSTATATTAKETAHQPHTSDYYMDSVI